MVLEESETSTVPTMVPGALTAVDCSATITGV
jgi:hypothetical protein